MEDRVGSVRRAGLIAPVVMLLLGAACEPRPEPSGPASKPAPEPPPAQPAPPAPPPTPEPAAEVPPAPTPEEVLAYDEADPLAELEKADGLTSAAVGDLSRKPAPKQGCAVVDGPRRLRLGGSHPALTATGHGFALAGYATRDGVESVFVIDLPSAGAPRPVTSFPVPVPYPREREAGPGLSARNEQQVTLAITDGKGALHVREVELGKSGPGALRSIATGVDTRFAPAIAHDGENTLVAYTQGSTPMHTRVVVLDRLGAVRATHDVTPPSSGAAAPAFVEGANPPSLLTVDARDGMSPVSRTDFAPNGTPNASEVAVPVGMVSSPPQLAAASSPVGTYLAYTGLGSAATSAIGLVALAPVQGTPSALVPGNAYGRLYVAAATAPRAVLIAADTPTRAGKEAPRQVLLHVVNVAGADQGIALAGPDGTATQAAVARDEGGVVAVAFNASGAIYVARLRCADE